MNLITENETAVNHAYYLVDGFTDSAFNGAQLAVFPRSEVLDDGQMPGAIHDDLVHGPERLQESIASRLQIVLKLLVRPQTQSANSWSQVWRCPGTMLSTVDQVEKLAATHALLRLLRTQ